MFKKEILPKGKTNTRKTYLKKGKYQKGFFLKELLESLEKILNGKNLPKFKTVKYLKVFPRDNFQ